MSTPAIGPRFNWSPQDVAEHGPSDTQTVQPRFAWSDKDPMESPGKATFNPPGGAQGERPFTDKLLDYINPVVSGVAGAAAGTAASADPFTLGPVGGAAVGAGTYMATHMAMQGLYQQPPLSYASQWAGYEPGSFKAEAMNAGQDALSGELLGPIVGKAISTAKQAIVGNPAFDAAYAGILKLKPGTSQLYQAVFGKNATVSSWIQNAFDNLGSQDARNRAAGIAMNQETGDVAKLAGRSQDVTSSPIEMSQNIKSGAWSSAKQSIARSGAFGQSLELDAAANPHSFQGNLANSPEVDAFSQKLAGKNFKDLDPQGQQAILATMKQMGIQAPIRNIEGPVTTTTALDTSNKILQQLTGGAKMAKIPSDQPLVDTIRDFHTAANAKFTPDGQLLSSDPISFKDALNFKKLAGQYGWGDASKASYITDPATGKATVAPVYRDVNFQNISNALDHDITSSIQNDWKNSATGQTLNNWRNMKAVVAERHLTFDQDGLHQLMNSNNDVMPEVGGIIRDSQQLKRTLNAGQLDLKGGVIASTNIKQDLGAYARQEFLNAPYFKSDNLGKGSFDTNAIQAQLTKNEENYRTLWGDTGFENTRDFYHNLAFTQGKEGMQGMGRLPIYAIRGGIVLSAGMIGGHLSIPAGVGAAGLTGVLVGGNGIGRMLNNPTVAKFLVSAAAGQNTPQMQVISREIVGLLQGKGDQLTLLTKNGNKIQGTIGKDGTFEEQR